MSAQPPPFQRKHIRLKRLGVAVLAAASLTLLVVLGRAFAPSQSSPVPPPIIDPPESPHELITGKHLTLWWNLFPDDVRQRSMPPSAESNIHPTDYLGPQVCRQCHSQNYESWSTHPHRFMNALASAATVKGDFSGASIPYQGGRATFYRQDDGYFMRMERGELRRTYTITQTIGSRFFQYYVGKQIEGPEPKSHHFYRKDHVLYFGYWLSQKEWAPVIHIGSEEPDGQRADPFQPPQQGRNYAEYATSCNYCHTTFPLADLFVRIPSLLGENAPLPLHWSMRNYMQAAHPEKVVSRSGLPDQQQIQDLLQGWEAPTYAVTLGVSCEACHLGAKRHAQSGGRIPPKFFPSSPYLLVEAKQPNLDFGRTHDNVNWACGRCHTGNRPRFAAGMSTWNSVEYADAMRGSCYSKLRCIDCHNPHKAIGPKWTWSADQDDAVCLKCHEKLSPAAARVKHTHHSAGSEGARCLNCHMPRINEGLNDVVRTHMIYSPTRPDMIQANHPNACNLCHTDRPIDWTLGYLKQWYGARYDEGQIAAQYPDRSRPVALGWLKSENPAVRLVAGDALTRVRDFQALPQLLDALDDPYLVNRQFAYKELQEMLQVRLADFGYRFYMTSDERRLPLANLRSHFSQGVGSK